MKRLRKTAEFTKWFEKLRDDHAIARITTRIRRLADGNPGDSRFLGDGVSEMRIDYGPGYRIYFTDTGKEIILLLCGGDKTTQQMDIKRAKDFAKSPMKEEKQDGSDNGK